MDLDLVNFLYPGLEPLWKVLPTLTVLAPIPYTSSQKQR